MVSAPYPPFHKEAKRDELRSRLNSFLVEPLASDRPRPTFRTEELLQEGKLEQFLGVFDWVLGEALASPYGNGNLDGARAEVAASEAGEE